MAPLGLPWSYSSSSSDPAHGTREEAGRSMRHANSPRRLRRLFSLRRFHHTAFSPPPCTRAMHSCLPGPSPDPPPAGGARRANRNARLSHIREFAWLAPSHHRVRDTAYPSADRRSGDLTAESRTLGGNRQPRLAPGPLDHRRPLVEQQLSGVGVVAFGPQVRDGVG